MCTYFLTYHRNIKYIKLPILLRCFVIWDTKLFCVISETSYRIFIVIHIITYVHTKNDDISFLHTQKYFQFSHWRSLWCSKYTVSFYIPSYRILCVVSTPLTFVDLALKDLSTYFCLGGDSNHRISRLKLFLQFF